jgi:hypothetical protein
MENLKWGKLRMRLSEVTIYPRVYNVIETTDPRFTKDEIKVCQVSETSLIVAVGSGLAFVLSKEEAKQIIVESR